MADIVYTQDEGNEIVVVQGSDYTVCALIESGVEIEKISFLQLNDTPSSYEEKEGFNVTVKEDGSGLEFTKSYKTFISLDDTPASYENNVNKVLVVNQKGDGIAFSNYNPADINIENFTELGDVPNSYVNQKGKFPVVNDLESGLQFKDIETVLPNQKNVSVGSYVYPQITVDAKGRITYIKEGKPFEFDAFYRNRLLVGDGSTIPSQVPLGSENMLLKTNSNSEPSWDYINSLYKNGKELLEVTNASDSNSSKLQIRNTANSISFIPQDNNVSIGFGYATQLQVTNSNINLNRELYVPTSVGLTTVNGFKIASGTGTVGIKGIDADDYSEKITDNDFITKKWYDKKQQEIPDISLSNVCVRSNIWTLDTSIIQFEIPNGAVIKSLDLIIQTPFNESAGLWIYDSAGVTLLNSVDSPILDEATTIILNQRVTTSNYRLYVRADNRTYGTAQAYVTYFQE